MKHVQAIILVAACLAIGLLALVSSGEAGEPITPNEINELKASGLAEYTAQGLQALHADPAGARHPKMSFNMVKKMLEAGLPDDVIRLMIGLDWMTIQDRKIPILPEKVLDLYASGADIGTVRTMLAAEVASVNQKLQTMETDLDHAGWNAVRPDAVQPGPGIVHERQMPVLPDPQADLDNLRLGRQKLTRPDGKQVMVYRSPFEDHTTRLGRQIYQKPNGKQTVIYSSPFDEPDPARLSRTIVNRPDGKQVVVYTSADPINRKKKGRDTPYEPMDPREIMKQLRLYPDLDRYLPQKPRRQPPSRPYSP